MSPEQMLIVALFIAREIKALIDAKKAITEAELAALIAANFLKIDVALLQMKAEMDRYGA